MELSLSGAKVPAFPANKQRVKANATNTVEIDWRYLFCLPKVAVRKQQTGLEKSVDCRLSIYSKHSIGRLHVNQTLRMFSTILYT